MASLKDIKVRIASVQKTKQITKAMQMVASSRMKKATDAIVNARPYAEKLQHVLSNLESSDSSFGNHFFDERAVKNVLIIVVAADKGLCGAFNSNIRKKTIQLIRRYQKENIGVKLLSCGKKAVEFNRKLDVEVLKEYSELFRDLKFNDAVAIMSQAKTLFSENDVDAVDVVYNQFISVVSQVPVSERVLPIAQKKEESVDLQDYIYEPSKVEILSTLVPRYLNMAVWKALLESNASEQAAKMMAMDSATNNATDMIKKLRLKFNKIRQASITTEIAEIVGGAEALNG
ncbi:MAG: ATP synthase F1 subunit gamma [Calditrichaeota bacterium]|nr:ATP synthase F1 subunit gamma [Calditrichota bacterium]